MFPLLMLLTLTTASPLPDVQAPEPESDRQVLLGAVALGIGSSSTLLLATGIGLAINTSLTGRNVDAMANNIIYVYAVSSFVGLCVLLAYASGGIAIDVAKAWQRDREDEESRIRQQETSGEMRAHPDTYHYTKSKTPTLVNVEGE